VFDFLRRLFARPSADPLDGLEPGATRLVVGLGNPGPEYADTRHNVGFRCVEELARRSDARWTDRSHDLDCLISTAQIAHLTLVLAKPQTYMNRSGAAVHGLLRKLGIPREQCLVVYDDMDLPFGTLRLRERGSPGTHNGMRSVVASLHDDSIPRLRIGISQASPGNATNHVLSEFDAAERAAVADLVERAADAAVAWAIHGPATAMNRYNSLKIS
jgi:PTH1 family peptidyl-tRNA hydrolase